ncbi:unnamed protein product [Lepeophtheirus salmonis]|uniref:(salmon louse) hypothetical protein n=1 Tax=Lepeophtheirus salmonis TaxID=72036 RepID=A0A7R8CZQ7_LEPSM|nr:unnamed protein product [Lepeophtheirus salmonis]CAF2977932.1 unnamed protein product [Lepeophtheirus salmonis]
MENIISYAADGTPVMMGKKKGCLKLMKDENPEMILVHCVIHRDNKVAKNITHPLNEVLRLVIKCINTIKANTKCEPLLEQFCENADYVRLLLHTDVLWHSKGNCLKRFMVLYDILSVFLSDNPKMNNLQALDGKSFVSYLTDIFEKWNMLNKQLQGSNKTLVDGEKYIRVCYIYGGMSRKHFSQTFGPVSLAKKM